MNGWPCPTFLRLSSQTVWFLIWQLVVLPPFLCPSEAGNVLYRVSLGSSPLLQLYPPSNGLL